MPPYNVKPTKPARERISRSQIRGLMDDDFERVEEKPVRNTPLAELQKMPEHKILGSITFNASAKRETSVPEVFKTGLNESILNPREPVPQVPNVFQREFATFNLNPAQIESAPKFDILSQASQIVESTWNAFGNAAQDTVKETGGAIGEIAEILSGTGEFKPESQENAHPQNSANENPPNQQDSPLIQDVLKFLAETRAAQDVVKQEQLMKESLRITDKIVTAQDAQEAGVSAAKEHLLTTATLHAVADRTQEVVEEVEEKQEATQKAPGFVMGENELEMGTERSGGGHWSTGAG